MLDYRIDLFVEMEVVGAGDIPRRRTRLVGRWRCAHECNDRRHTKGALAIR
jgi:hypothetical protein